jgi:hypothetical protein
MARPAIERGQGTNDRSTPFSFAPVCVWDERQVGHARLPICNALQMTLTKCGFLQRTMTIIAEDCGSVNRYISTMVTAVDFEK